MLIDALKTKDLKRKHLCIANVILLVEKLCQRVSNVASQRAGACMHQDQRDANLWP